MSRPTDTACARCDWQGDALAEHAADAGHPICVVCQRASLRHDERQTCLPCLGRARRNLADIVEGYALLPLRLDRLGSNAPQRRDGGPSASDGRPLPGGDVLVLLAPGSAGSAARRLSDFEAAQGVEGREHGRDHHPADAPSVAYELGRWEDDWRRQFGHPAAQGEATVVTAAAYLNDHMGDAASTHPAFDEFAGDVRKLLAAVQVAAGIHERPVRGVPCFDENCQRKPLLERHWTEEGLSDTWWCPACRRTYEDHAYWLAVRADLEKKKRQQDDEDERMGA